MVAPDGQCQSVGMESQLDGRRRCLRSVGRCLIAVLVNRREVLSELTHSPVGEAFPLTGMYAGLSVISNGFTVLSSILRNNTTS